MSVISSPDLSRRSAPEADRLLRARYGGHAHDFPPVLSPTIAGQLKHRSVRAFDDRPLPDGALETIVAAAQSASTSSNLQQWSVVAVADPERRRVMAQLCSNQAAILQAPVFLAWIADLSRLQALAGESGARALGTEYLDSFMEGVIDVSLAAQSAMVALESLGLGGVFIGSLRNRPDAVARELNLPPLAAPIFGMCVGYPAPDDSASVKPRLPQSAVLHRETYDPARAAGETAAFEALTREHQAAAGRSPAGWIAPSLERVTRPEKLGDRAFLRQALGRLGFGLK